MSASFIVDELKGTVKPTKNVGYLFRNSADVIGLRIHIRENKKAWLVARMWDRRFFVTSYADIAVLMEKVLESRCFAGTYAEIEINYSSIAYTKLPLPKGSVKQAKEKLKYE